MIHFKIIRTKHNGRENKNFHLIRPNGTNDYLFLHFKTPVIFTLFDKDHSVMPGTCIVLSPNTPHSFRPDGCELVHDWAHFMPTENDDFDRFGIDINAFFQPSNPDFITASIKRCELELINKSEFYQELISAEISRLFIILKRQLSQNVSGQHADSFKTLRADIYRNPHKFTNTEDMASAVNLSRSRFSVLYKEIFGVSPQSDHISAKVSKASYLLSVGTLSLAEISEICGYSNIYHFIRQFRTVTGITPGAYRKNH